MLTYELLSSSTYASHSSAHPASSGSCLPARLQSWTSTQDLVDDMIRPRMIVQCFPPCTSASCTCTLRWTIGHAYAAAGLNVARLAGLPESVLRRADVFAKRIEVEDNYRMLAMQGGGAAARVSLGHLRQLMLALSGHAKIDDGKGALRNLMPLWRISQSL